MTTHFTEPRLDRGTETPPLLLVGVDHHCAAIETREKVAYGGDEGHALLRCLVAADGYYEWRKTPQGKQPYLFQLSDSVPFAFAGLWESWNRSDTGEPLETCTIITTEANDLTKPIHDRMPVILPPEAYADWLDPEQQDAAHLQPLLAPFPPSDMTATPVSTWVNNPRHDDAKCVEAQQELF